MLQMIEISGPCSCIMLILEQGWPTQLQHWANISAPILKRAAKLLLMTNSHYFASFSSNFLMTFFENLIFPPLYLPKAYLPKFFRHLNKIDLPRKIFPPLKKELNLTIVKRAAQACQVGRMRP